MNSAAAIAIDEAALNRGAVTVFIMMATAMQALDTTIANVALPDMQSSLGAAQDTIMWVLTSYIVAAAIMTPVTGWLSDRLGRKKLFLGSVVGFTISSALCGLATGLDEMVLFRLFQGVFGAALVPLSQAVLLDINPKERHGQAMAMWGAGIMVAPIIGPTLGGWLTDNFNWRWVFYINVPVGIIAFVGMWAFLPNTPLRRRRFDIVGFALLSMAVGAFQLLLDRGQEQDWFGSMEIWMESGVALAGLWMFLIHTFTKEDPFVNPQMFKDRNLVVGLVFIFCVGIVLLATLALLPPMMQSLYEYPIMTTGLVLAPRGMGTMAAMLMVGRLVQRVDARLLILGGLGLTALSLWDMAGFSPQMGSWEFVASGVVQGLGLGFIFVPLSTVTFTTIEPQFRTEATSLYSLMRNLGSSLGVSIMATLLAQNTQINHVQLAAKMTPFNPMLAQAGIDPATAAGALQLDAMVNQQAAMIAYLNDFKLMMWMTLAVAPLLLLMARPKKAKAAEAVVME